MTDLAAFLLERIADDETEARRAIDVLRDPALLGRVIPGWHSWPQRLAECEAKRRIVEDWRKATDDYSGDTSGRIAALAFSEAMRALALPYVDHPDYREEWRP